MKIVCTQENFKKAVHDTERVIGRQATLPILGNILIKTEKGRLRFSATNLEIGVISDIGAKIEEEGSITVSAKLLGSFIHNLPPADKISLNITNGNILEIVSGEYRAQIKGLDAQDFPLIPEMKGEYLFSIPSQTLKDIIPRLSVSVSHSETRPEFSGINVIFEEDKIYLASTDTFRLAEQIIVLEEKNKNDNYNSLVDENKTIIIPGYTFNELSRLIDSVGENINISIEENQIFFNIGDTQVVSRLINGKFPDYKQIIPTEFSTRAVIDKEDLARAVKIASVFTNAKAGEICLKVEKNENKFTVESQSTETGENETKLQADIVGSDQEINFNPKYVLDGINVISSEKLAFLANNNASPAALRMINQKDGTVVDSYTYIIMPIKN